MKTFSTRERMGYLFSLPVIVASLGYFVDIYDLLLFGIVRLESIRSLGITQPDAGAFILNWQMAGLLIGGILWGILGDKKGRLSVLFGSILLYSTANILCGFLPHIGFMDKLNAYALLRFIAGIGLAGELGAGITLVAESLPRELRALGTSLVAGFGLLGAVVAGFTVKLSSDWTISYFIGGIMGIGLLFLRIGVLESGMFKEVRQTEGIKRGSFLYFFSNRDRLLRYLKCIAIGLPTWYCIGILAFFCDEIGRGLGISEVVKPQYAIPFAYAGISVGDFASGFLSNRLRSRKRSILYMLLFTLLGVVLMLFGPNGSATSYYVYCVWLGLGTGYWAMFVTLGAEQFGTNIRSTAATTIPNMVRGLLVVMVLLYDWLKPGSRMIYAAAVVGVIAFGLAFYSSLTISETHDKDLNFIE